MKQRPVDHGRGLRGLDRHAWVTLAEERVHDLVNTGLAAPHVEIEARLWDTGWKPPGEAATVRFFPHILSEALNNLTSNGNIKLVSHGTKGGVIADLYVPSDIARRATSVAAATRRKAMLYARFNRLSSTFGPAGESVVRASLHDASHLGYFPITEGFGEIRKIGSLTLPGALDSGAWTLFPDPDRGIPTKPLALLVEVKNRRLTLYPRHPEVHQLLLKAALTQQEHPDLNVVPLLICRRAHDRLFWMAKDLGFLVHATRAQYLSPKKTTISLVEEVRIELGLADLRVVTRDSAPRIINLFAETVPASGPATAKRWAAVGARLLPHFQALRPNTLDPATRSAALADLRAEAEVVLTAAGVSDPILAWALAGEEEPTGWI